jgi:hypothetical protein
MAQEAIGMGPGEYDGVDVWIAVCAIDQLLELPGHLGIEQRVWASVEAGDEYPGVAFDGDVSCGVRCAS